jgi:hypothetical protein
MLLADARANFKNGATDAETRKLLSGWLQAHTGGDSATKHEKTLPVVSAVKDYVFLVLGFGQGGKVRLHERLITLSFDDTEAVLRGSLTIRNQDYRDKPTLAEGDRVELHFAPIGTEDWSHWWTMRTVKPAVTYYGGEETYTLASDLDRLQRSTDDFQYKQSKKKKYWLAREIVADICHKYGIRCVLTDTYHHFLEMVREGSSPMDVINEVMDKERSTTGRRYAIWFETVTGTLWVWPRTRQAALYKLANACIEAQTQMYLHDRFATALTLRGPKFTNSGEDIKQHDRTDTGKNTASKTAGSDAGPAGTQTGTQGQQGQPGAYGDR